MEEKELSTARLQKSGLNARPVSSVDSSQVLSIPSGLHGEPLSVEYAAVRTEIVRRYSYFVQFCLFSNPK
jgi:hypothetical protein